MTQQHTQLGIVNEKQGPKGILYETVWVGDWENTWEPPSSFPSDSTTIQDWVDYKDTCPTADELQERAATLRALQRCESPIKQKRKR